MPTLKPALDSAYSRKGIPIAMTDQSNIQLLQKNPQLFSTSTLALTTTEKPGLKILSFNGVKPSVENLSNGSYPLNKPLFLLHNGQLNDVEQRFLNFVLSTEGLAILVDTGHLPRAQ